MILVSALNAQDIIAERYASHTDVWVLIPYNNIIFAKNAETARYQISIVIRTDKKKQAARHEETLSILRDEHLDNTALPFSFRTNLSPGKYTATMIFKNLSLGDKRDFTKTLNLGSEYSEIGLAYPIASLKNQKFIPTSLSNLSFPLSDLKLIQSYSIPADSIWISIGDLNLDPISGTVSDLTGNIYDEKGIFTSVNPGSYEVNLLPYLPILKEHPLKIGFFEKNIRYQMAPFLFNNWYFYGLKYSPREQMEQIRYIATQNEWSTLSSVPKGQYLESIDHFWAKHDPSPGTIRNEAREDFYSRVARADELFTIHKKISGWKSDRGRIYIKYGPPDDISSEILPTDRLPYIVWTYYKSNKQFYFSDSGGFGQYQLRNKDEEF